uniref:Uncharacterized protein n=1 Tax=Timema genevievae TaxID=629358 RepID=A0A7R9PQY9_TIMGE|nr:unnamed protein product [Timema genevievae]
MSVAELGRLMWGVVCLNFHLRPSLSAIVKVPCPSVSAFMSGASVDDPEKGRLVASVRGLECPPLCSVGGFRVYCVVSRNTDSGCEVLVRGRLRFTARSSFVGTVRIHHSNHRYVHLKFSKWLGDTEDEEDRNDALDMSWPNSARKRITYVLVAPILIPLWMTLPDTKSPKAGKLPTFAITPSVGGAGSAHPCSLSHRNLERYLATLQGKPFGRCPGTTTRRHTARITGRGTSSKQRGKTSCPVRIRAVVSKTFAEKLAQNRNVVT